jgi:hypothetical protein
MSCGHLYVPVAYELVVQGDVKAVSFTDTWKTGFSVLLPLTLNVVITYLNPTTYVYTALKNWPGQKLMTY